MPSDSSKNDTGGWVFSLASATGTVLAGGEPRPGEDQPRPVPGRDIPIQEPEPDRLPDEEPNPNPDENRDPPMHSSRLSGPLMAEQLR